MSREFKLPELGENIEIVEVASVMVAPGDTITKDQPVIEVETEKASLEVPAPWSGVVERVHVEAGQKIRVGDTLLTIAAAGEAEPVGEAAAAAGVVAAARSGPAAGETGPAIGEVRLPPEEPGTDVMGSAGPLSGEPAPAAPSVRMLARELGVDIDRVPGSGPGGRISAEDVKAFARRILEAGARGAVPDPSRWGEVEREPLSSVRRAVARNLARAWATVPQVTQFDRADITELEALRERFRQRVEAAGGKLTVTSFVLKVVASALKVFPKFNASLDLEHEQVIYRKYVHLGVAVDTDRGLLVPVIRDVDRRNLPEIALELAELSSRARARKLSPEQMQGACFTVTNLGGLGTTHFSPIVNWPEVAILGVGRAETQPLFRDHAFVPRRILPLSLSYDHRWIDGADAARFLRWVAEALEQPTALPMDD